MTIEECPRELVLNGNGRHSAIRACFAALLALGFWAAPVAAEDPVDPTTNPILEIDWQRGPSVGQLGRIAEIRIPDGAAFAEAEGAKRFLEITENIPSGNELGILLQPLESGEIWFAIFSFDPVGYVKDDEKDSLDSKSILETIKKGTEADNKLRSERGWSTMEIVGWEREPFYDAQTHNLTWAIRGRSFEGDVINYQTRLLGRGGVMRVNLVIDPALMGTQVPVFTSALSGFDFKSGNRYAEFRKGDKIASYGLTALVAGGAAAIATKTGLLAKFWKLIVAGMVALAAGIRKLFGNRKGGTDPITRVPEREP